MLNERPSGGSNALLQLVLQWLFHSYHCRSMWTYCLIQKPSCHTKYRAWSAGFLWQKTLCLYMYHFSPTFISCQACICLASVVETILMRLPLKVSHRYFVRDCKRTKGSWTEANALYTIELDVSVDTELKVCWAAMAGICWLAKEALLLPGTITCAHATITACTSCC